MNPVTENPAEDFPPQLEFAATRPTPVWLTWVIVGANLLVFAAMAIVTQSPMSFAVGDLVAWGGSFAPAVYNGEGWRIFTAIFLHAGIVHLAMNIYVLAGIGPFMERAFGATTFGLLYLFAGVAGNVLGYLWHPHIVSVGASGAIFGLYGGLLGFLLVRRHSIPPQELKALLQNGLYFVGINLVLGFSMTGIDMAAHVVGAVAGFLGGIVASWPYPTTQRTAGVLRNLLLAGLTVATLAATPLCMTAPVKTHARYLRALDNWQAKETGVLNKYNELVAAIPQTTETGSAFARRLEEEVLDPWTNIVERFPPLGELPSEVRNIPVVPKIYAFLKATEDAFRLLIQANRQGDNALAEQSKAKLDEAARIVSEMKK